MNQVGYRGRRRDWLVKPQFFFYFALVLIVFAALIYLFFPPIIFIAMLCVCGAIASIIYFALLKAVDAGFLTGLTTALIWVIRVAFILMLISFVVVEFIVLTGEHTDSDAYSADYVIVLGCGVDGETPSLMLQSRIDAAAEYLNTNQRAKAILSGRQGPGEEITEAEALRRGMVARGIDGDRLILEERSSDTIENIRFSLDLIPSGSRVAVLSNDFHLYRARLIASHEGCDVSAVCAPTPRIDLSLCYTVREYFSLAKVFFNHLFA